VPVCGAHEDPQQTLRPPDLETLRSFKLSQSRIEKKSVSLAPGLFLLEIR
jgi:hypothetical protein